MTRPNDIKKAFTDFSAGRGIEDATKLRETDAIALFQQFYDAVAFDGRQQGSKEDVVAFQTRNPKRQDSWTASVTRQLYHNGHGTQLGLTWTYDGPSFLGDIRLSSEGSTASEWAAEASKEAVGIGAGTETPTSVTLTLSQL